MTDVIVNNLEQNHTEKNKMEKRMLSTKELADYIGLAQQTIKNQYYDGRFPIPATRLGRKLLWDKKIVDRFLDKLPKIDR
jgi:predicted DNA-binding transcriptional regulator AlpA